MTRYRTYPPVFMFLLSLFIAAVIMLAFAGCATPANQNGPTLAEIRESACPVILGTIIGLQVSPDITDDTKSKLKELEPVVTAGCAATSNLTDLKQMSESVFPLVLKFTADSKMTPEQKQTVIIGITTARLIIANYRQYQDAASAPVGVAQ